MRQEAVGSNAGGGQHLPQQPLSAHLGGPTNGATIACGPST